MSDTFDSFTAQVPHGRRAPAGQRTGSAAQGWPESRRQRRKCAAHEEFPAVPRGDQRCWNFGEKYAATATYIWVNNGLLSWFT